MLKNDYDSARELYVNTKKRSSLCIDDNTFKRSCIKNATGIEENIKKVETPSKIPNPYNIFIGLKLKEFAQRKS